MPTARYIDSLKYPRIPGFEWPEAQEPDDTAIFRRILEKGAQVFTNDARDGKRAHSYTVGLYLNFLHPEVVILGVTNDAAVAIFSKLRTEADSGKILLEGEVRTDLFSFRHEVKFIRIEDDLAKIDYLDHAAWFYRSLVDNFEPGIKHKFPVFQAVWADKNGFFPDNFRCEEIVRKAQAVNMVPTY
jgi:hypothetical protein